MSGLLSISTEATRQRLSPRQAETVQRLVTAAVDELRAVGFDDLTVRTVARRAGVAPATAYTYFTSKEHLVTLIFWRRLQALPETEVDRRRSVVARVSATLTDLSLLVADEPEVTAAYYSAMLAPDPDVHHLRDRIGLEFRRRLTKAIGNDMDAPALRALELCVSGAFLQAGMGHFEFSELPDRLAEAARLLLGNGRR